MTDADRVYREAARRQATEAAAAAAATRERAEEQARTRRAEIDALIPKVLDALKSHDYPGGQLIEVSKYRAIRGTKKAEVAAWYVGYTRRKSAEYETQIHYYLTSAGRITAGVHSEYIDLTSSMYDDALLAIRSGLENLRQGIDTRTPGNRLW